MTPTATPFPDGVGDGLVGRIALHCRRQCMKLQMHALDICTHWLLRGLVSVQFDLDGNMHSNMRSQPVRHREVSVNDEWQNPGDSRCH